LPQIELVNSNLMVIEEIKTRTTLFTKQAFYTQFLCIIFHIFPARGVWSKVFWVQAFILRNIDDVVMLLLDRRRPAATAVADAPTGGKATVHSFSSQAGFWLRRVESGCASKIAVGGDDGIFDRDHQNLGSTNWHRR
jgi:hypothetical protein